MSLPKPEPLCRYRYDPQDRLAGSSPLGQADTHCFYRLNRLTTEIQGQIGTSWLQAQDQLLAQWQQGADKHERVLIATDAPGSVIHGLGSDQSRAFAYMPYGTRAPTQAPLHLPGFNGERRDPVTGHYLLGNGYRAFNPVLMRFNSPDSLSPFGEGGLNAYAYCVGDPVNCVDPTGHIPNLFKAALRRFGMIRTRHQYLQDLEQIASSNSTRLSISSQVSQASEISTSSAQHRVTSTQPPLDSIAVSQRSTGRRVSEESISMETLKYNKESARNKLDYLKYKNAKTVLSGGQVDEQFLAEFARQTFEYKNAKHALKAALKAPDRVFLIRQ